MARDYVPLYRSTHGEAERWHELPLWEESFRENVACARAIEKALRVEYQKTGPIPPDCAAQVLKDYGFKRVNFVLQSTVLDLKDVNAVLRLLDEDTIRWANTSGIMPDKVYGHYYCVDTAAGLLDAFIHEAREAYQALGLFNYSHCSMGMYDEDVDGKVLVMNPSTLKESCWSQENQLWLATGGFGCDPKGRGRAIFATCLADGERTRWNRGDFVGVLDAQYLPKWAKQKLEALTAPEQAADPVMGGMNMR